MLLVTAWGTVYHELKQGGDLRGGKKRKGNLMSLTYGTDWAKPLGKLGVGGTEITEKKKVQTVP